jgi:hypothetical protein
MPADPQKLRDLMDKHFGPMGGFLLEKEMRLVGIHDLKDADESTLARLAEGIYRDCLFTIMSETKARMILSEIQSILDVKIPPLEGTVRHMHAPVARPLEL